MRQYCGVIDCMFRKLSLPRDRVEPKLYIPSTINTQMNLVLLWVKVV